jgi:hypothetical protein
MIIILKWIFKIVFFGLAILSALYFTTQLLIIIIGLIRLIIEAVKEFWNYLSDRFG